MWEKTPWYFDRPDKLPSRLGVGWNPCSRQPDNTRGNRGCFNIVRERETETESKSPAGDGGGAADREAGRQSLGEMREGV